jgi:hypothetical protein
MISLCSQPPAKPGECPESAEVVRDVQSPGELISQVLPGKVQPAAAHLCFPAVQTARRSLQLRAGSQGGASADQAPAGALQEAQRLIGASRPSRGAAEGPQTLIRRQ